MLALAGLHRTDRGAEVALIEIGRQLAQRGHRITLFGSGYERPAEPYDFVHVPSIARERFEHWPTFPLLRNETGWEEATFAAGLLAKSRLASFDIAATCSYPFTLWALRRPVRGKRPKSVFITQNGDWPAYSNDAEFQFFACDGLICTNPDYFKRNQDNYRCALISNGVDLDRFFPGSGERTRFDLPKGPVVLMVSALIPSKNVQDGISAIARAEGVNLVVAGDGPLRDEVRRQADEMLPGRFHQLTVSASEMPELYRSADAFMHLSVDESFGNVFVEAMASGLPIIAYDTPRTRWIVGDDAFFARARDVSELCKSLNDALAKPSLTGPKMRSRARQFDWSAVAGKYEKFFEDLLHD